MLHARVAQGLVGLGLTFFAFCGTANAVPFQAVIDQFSIAKNGSLIFIDKFDDGHPPPSGPDGANTYGSGTQFGLGGMTSESGGKLTMTPSLGAPTQITNGFADTVTRGFRIASTDPTNPNYLGKSDLFQIRGIFDLSSLPTVTGQAFGIRAGDGTGPGTADDVAQLSISMNQQGIVGVRLGELSVPDNQNDPVDFVSIASVLPHASQVELVLTHKSGSSTIIASFTIMDAIGNVLQSGTLDTINNVTGQQLTLFNGEDFTRAEFFASDTGIPVPEPGTLLIFELGLVGTEILRRRFRA